MENYINSEYDCHTCCYRDKAIDFCGFCTRKLLDEMMIGRKKKYNGEKIQDTQNDV